jgi:ABC-2 type transport system ATP-binding protein
MSAPGIDIRHLAKRYGDFEALRDLSLEIRPGETFGLLGPNGAGKTTTLSMLSTLLPPTRGDARIFGRSLTEEVAEVRRLVGLAPQEISLYPDLTAQENLAFFGRLHGLRGAELSKRSDRLLELVGLTARGHDRVRTYSGGMKRRLNLACGLLHQPRLLLLDEPTVGVDPQSRENLFTAIRAIASEGTTILYTTHYMDEAERMCDRIAILDEGSVIAVGTLEELLELVGMGEVIEIHTTAVSMVERNLRALPEVTRVETSGARILIFVKSAARALGPISAALAEAEGEVEEIEVYRVNLERVFMHLTGKELRD